MPRYILGMTPTVELAKGVPLPGRAFETAALPEDTTLVSTRATYPAGQVRSQEVSVFPRVCAYGLDAWLSLRCEMLASFRPLLGNTQVVPPLTWHFSRINVRKRFADTILVFLKGVVFFVFDW